VLRVVFTSIDMLNL